VGKRPSPRSSTNFSKLASAAFPFERGRVAYRAEDLLSAAGLFTPEAPEPDDTRAKQIAQLEGEITAAYEHIQSLRDTILRLQHAEDRWQRHLKEGSGTPAQR
jgi:hypothetical protein